jgi:DNA invertase Pin-like site-specific DNA recombinase
LQIGKAGKSRGISNPAVFGGSRVWGPKGPAAALKLDEREDEIVGYLKKSISKRAIAKLTDCAPSTLYKWMKRRKIEKKALQSV